MSVFRNYDPKQSGKVNAQAHPNVHVYPWIPTQRNVRSNPNIPSQPQRVGPQERGTFFPTSATAGGTLAPSMSSCAGCAGCSGCGGSMLPTPTASDMATDHSLPASSKMRLMPRVTGSLRAGPRVSSRASAGGASIRSMMGR
jgi:hypothetical protein